MDHSGLMERLVAERRPSWLVHRSAPGRTPSGALDQCRDAWNLWAGDGGWWIVRGWGARRTEERFDSEEAACAVLYDRVVATGETDVRALALAELPPPVQRLVRIAGLELAEQRPGDLLVAGRRVGMGLRVVETPSGYRVDRPSVFPPTVGESWFAGLAREDACRVVMLAVGAELPTRPGTPRYGIRPPHDRQEALDLLRPHSLERIERAYLGAPEGVLELLAPPAAIGLLTDGLVALAEASGLVLGSHGGADGVALVDPGGTSFAIRRVDDGFVLESRGERRTDWTPLGTHRELAEARAALVAAVLPREHGSGLAGRRPPGT